MKRAAVLIVAFILTVVKAGAQDAEKSYGIKFSGFVKTDIFYDSRQSSASNGLREGHFFPMMFCTTMT